MERRVLVTGGSGFLGTNLVEYHRTHGDTVLSIDPSPPRNTGHRPLWQCVDPLDERAVTAVVRTFDPTHVIHMGARTDLRGKHLADYASNTAGVEVVVEALRRARSVQRVIFASSRMVCRIGYQPRSDDDYCPTTIYGESKVVGERIVRSAGLDVPWLIVRPTSIWGPWFDVPYRDFFLTVARGRYVHVRGATVLKSFGYVENTVHELDRLLVAPAERVAGSTLYLADYPPLEVRSWVELIRRELGAPPIRAVPKSALRTAARVGDALEALTHRPATLTSFRLANLLTPMVYDVEPLREIVGELPVTLPDGVRRTVAWLRESRVV